MDRLKRKELIILHLLDSREFVTALELSRKLNVSTKTIYRLIKEINDESSSGMLIYSRKGSGYKLNYEKYLKNTPKEGQNTSLSPTERRNNIMEELLLRSPNEKNIFELYEQYYISESVIANDEKLISKILEKYDLELIRNNFNIKILGRETNIRRAISDLIQTSRTLINIDELKDNKIRDFNRYDVDFILYQINIIENNLQIKFPHPYDVNVFSHLYILLSRVRKIGNVLIKQDNILEDKQIDEMKADINLYHIAKEVMNNIEKYLNTNLPKSETYYLYQYLISSRMQTESKVVKEDQILTDEVKNITNFYINEMQVRLNINFNRSKLFNSLSAHIQPMLNRLKHGINVKNNLLKQIQLEYEQIFINLKVVSKSVSKKYNYPKINDSENGFLALYFAQAIEGLQNKINTIIMCTSGIGTSELLRVKITKRFPELRIIGVISTYDTKKTLEEYPNTELIITTINPTEGLNIPTLMVSALFTLEDQQRVQDIIEGFRNEK
jgi:transcriptional antiterminator